MKEKKLQDYVSVVENNIKKDLQVITSIVYKYDIRKILDELNTLSKKEQDKVLEMCINNYLTKIKNSSLNQKSFQKMERNIDEIIDFYEEDDIEEEMEEASNVSFDLIMKVIGHNDRKIKLPVDIDFIKSYWIHNVVKEENIQYTVLFIVLILSSVCYCLENKEYIEND